MKRQPIWKASLAGFLALALPVPSALAAPVISATVVPQEYVLSAPAVEYAVESQQYVNAMPVPNYAAGTPQYGAGTPSAVMPQQFDITTPVATFNLTPQGAYQTLYQGGYQVMSVPYSSQCYPYGAWVGCEPTCLYMALRYRGAAQGLTLKDFLDGLPRDASNPARGFVGSPYQESSTLRTTIYPAKLAEYGRNYYAGVSDFSGASTAQIQAEVLAGNPVVVYVTYRWRNPVYRSYVIDGETQRLISNNHAVLVTGYDASTGKYHITDPYNRGAKNRSAPYTYWVDGGTFASCYNVRQHALVIR